MSKIEKIIFIFLFVVSCIYSYVQPDEKIENIESVPNITIYIEGKVQTSMTYDHNPTIKEIFQDIDLENDYGFDESYCLNSQDVFYIPLGENLVSINYASQEELMTINGIGEKMSLKIIEHRSEEKFHTIEDIMKINGIGEKTYLKIREYICL